MAAAAIHVVPDDNFDDWVVRADIGQEFGHYPTLEAAERIGQASARARGRTRRPPLRRKNTRTRFAKKLGRHDRGNRATPCYTFMPSTCSRVHASS